MAAWKCILMMAALFCIVFSSAHDHVKPEVHVSKTMEPILTARLLKDSNIHPTDLGGGSSFGYIRWGGIGGGAGQGWGSGGASGYGQSGGWGSGSGYAQGGGSGSGSGGPSGYGPGSGWGSGSGGAQGYGQGSGWGSGGTSEFGQGGGWGSGSASGFVQGGGWGSGQGGGWGSSGAPGVGQRGGQFSFGGGGSIGFIPPFGVGNHEPFHCKPESCLSGVPCPNKFVIYPTQNNYHSPSIKKEEAMAPSPSK